MRKETKYILAGAAIVGFVFAVIDWLKQYDNHIKEDKPLNWENFNARQSVKKTLLGAGVGAFGGWLAYKYMEARDNGKSFSADGHLATILKGYNLKKDKKEFYNGLKLRDRISNFLNEAFADQLIDKIHYSGSFPKRTAINSNYDYDIVLPFRRGAFRSLEEMYESICKVVSKEYSDVASIRRQGKSIGITFTIEGKEYHFDVVPGREIRDYFKNGNLNLFVKGNLLEKNSSMKTNIFKQKALTINRPRERQIIKLIKGYRDNNGLNFSSIAIENLVLEAFGRRTNTIDSTLSSDLLYCMKYISKKIEIAFLPDAGNSNNNIMDSMSYTDKEEISNLLKSDLDRIKNNLGYLKEIFELNS